MARKYLPEELRHRGDTPEEHDRLRNIFDDLVNIGNAGGALSMSEQEHVVQGVEFFNENPNNYPFAEDARFRCQYLTYCLDITGGRRYFKARFGMIIQVPLLERDNDLNFLIDEASKWKAEIDSSKVPADELKKEAIKEAREDLRALAKHYNISDNPFLLRTSFYEYKVYGILLRSKANYIFGKKYLEETETSNLSFTFCGETIEFTAFSLIHIMNRHFAELTKQYPSGKDYHNEDIAPWLMPLTFSQ